MDHSTSDQPRATIPTGMDFFDAVLKAEDACAQSTRGELARLGISAPLSFVSLGNVLSMLYAEASCAHGCVGGDHFWQRLVARVVSHSLASVRLARSGYYDESLSLARSIGEIANLMFLFAAKPEHLALWQAADEKHRKIHYGPAKVRLAIEGLGLVPPIDESRYSLLCEVGVHLVPSVSPQAFEQDGRPSLGAIFKDTEFMTVLNELCAVVAECAGCLSAQPFVGARAVPLRAGAQVLLNMVGSLDLRTAKNLSASGV